MIAVKDSACWNRKVLNGIITVYARYISYDITRIFIRIGICIVNPGPPQKF